MNILQLNTKAKEYNRSKWRKDVLSKYKAIRKQVKRCAEKGDYEPEWTVSSFSHHMISQYYAAIRLFKMKHLDIDVKLNIKSWDNFPNIWFNAKELHIIISWIEI
ncbi:hypothetical protein CLV62_12527 [Dysgonomonas alginatilytica]|uniref:Uncharacterized protein n=1 Tax=Dysgonomonas alginatilytica TaxID=1605892 RepID=A0A2V3PLY2_9BACT|nr:hypothetical protein [Dysgonomonas alginatilytica]PXV61194.1 hypothetical protein CLV62_12527 [Dysgonomonas alginatilytica]